MYSVYLGNEQSTYLVDRDLDYVIDYRPLSMILDDSRRDERDLGASTVSFTFVQHGPSYSLRYSLRNFFNTCPCSFRQFFESLDASSATTLSL